MKLLLTSGGLTNKKIADALLELVGKPAGEISIAFIPTAVNAEGHDKSWLINDLNNIKKQGYKFIDIVDISALPRNIWQPRLEAVDVLFFSGGNSPYLMKWIKESGLEELLSEFLKTKVYASISAGSLITSPTLELSSTDTKIFCEKNFGYASNQGLGLIDFYIRPHLNSPKFPKANKEFLTEVAKEIPQTIYGIDDQMAIKVFGESVEVIGEGEYLVFNK